MVVFLAFVVAGLLSVIITPVFMAYFTRKKIGQTTREEGPKWHQVKTGTPTMGGTVFVLVSCLVFLIFALILKLSLGKVLILLLNFLLFAAIGFVDDFLSIFHHQNEGLKPKQKFLAQLAFSAFIMLMIYFIKWTVYIPLLGWQIDHWLFLAIFIFIWITGFSNAVNLTDGLDGLATGLNIIAYTSYFYLAQKQSEQVIALFCMIVVGSLLGFLFFNHKPAKIFMGDVGSLALGAGLALISVLLSNPWSLLVIGLVFVIETASVILQVASFKLTGKRIFKMSPIHHHFEMSGWSEEKVVLVFWLTGLISSLIYFSIFF